MHLGRSRPAAGCEVADAQTAGAHSSSRQSRRSVARQYRAGGFVLGPETVEALDAASIKGLYESFDEAATARRQEERK